MLRILVVGSKGQLGTEIRHSLHTMRAEIGSLPDEYRDAAVIGVDVDRLDIRDAEAVRAFICDGHFDIVINCAAMTNVDGCDANEDMAFAVNAKGPENIARACEEAGAKLVHVSTDYVFEGTNPRALTEVDPTGPVSAYGRSKLAGEQAVLEYCSQSFIVRTAWLYGYVGGNFVKTMKRLGESHEYVSVVDDQIGSPTSANDLAYVILKLALTDYFGIYHCTNNGSCSWAVFAESIMHAFSLACEVRKCTSAEYKLMNPNAANRPAYSILDNKALRDTIGDEMRAWEDAFAYYATHFEEECAKRVGLE